MMSDCALLRLSTRPRSTSATSRRCLPAFRARAAPAFVFVIAARWQIRNGIRRNLLDAVQHGASHRQVCGRSARGVAHNKARVVASIEQIADVVLTAAVICL